MSSTEEMTELLVAAERVLVHMNASTQEFLRQLRLAGMALTELRDKIYRGDADGTN